MHDAQFSKRIKTAILRVKRNEKAVKLDELTFFQEAIGTPTSDRKNENFACAIDAVISPPSQNDEEEYEDIDVTLFNQLNDRTPHDYDWSRNYVHGQSDKLAQLGKHIMKEKTR